VIIPVSHGPLFFRLHSSSFSPAFTLVELLVVIVISGILMALLFPTVKSGLDRAKTAKCASNLRQIGSGIHMFAADHDGTLPSLRIGTPADFTFWMNTIPSYLGLPQLAPFIDQNIYPFQRCSAVGKSRWFGDYGANYPHVFGNYSANAKRLANFTHPAGVIMVGDATLGTTGGGDWQMFCPVEAALNNAKDIPAPRHQGGGNFCFIDGHVEYFGPGRIQLLQAKPTVTEDYWGHFNP
jgi:prepilin-type processing-associated H-X9-DG protein/prepilin-type N-terminal cleavage/methylation domain-containing protein